MFKFRWDREWLKKLKGDRKVKFFQKFENHLFILIRFQQGCANCGRKSDFFAAVKL